MKTVRTSIIVLFALAIGGCGLFVWRDPRNVLPVGRAAGTGPRFDAEKIIEHCRTDDGGLVLTLPDCVALALSRNLSLKAVREEPWKATGDVFAATSAMLPQVSVSGVYTRIDQATTADFGGQTITISPQDRYKAELSIQQPVFQSGMAYHAAEAARIGKRIAELGVETAEEQVAFGVTASFYEALFTRAGLEVARENLQLARAHLDEVKKRLEQGMASRFEELRAQTRVSSMEAREIQARNQTALKKLGLLRLVGLPLDKDVELDGTLFSPPGSLPYDKAWSVARRLRTDLYASHLGVEAMKSQVRSIRGQLLPKLYAYFNWGWEKPSGKSFIAGGGAGYWNGGLSLSLPLFDGGAAHGRLLKAHASLRQAQFRLEDLREEIGLEIRKAILNLADAAEGVKMSQKNLRLAREGQRLAKVGYANGVNTQLDVLEADNQLAMAKYGMIQAFFGHTLAREALNRAMGAVRLLKWRRPAPRDGKKTDGTEAEGEEGSEEEGGEEG